MNFGLFSSKKKIKMEEAYAEVLKKKEDDLPAGVGLMLAMKLYNLNQSNPTFIRSYMRALERVGYYSEIESVMLSYCSERVGKLQSKEETEMILLYIEAAFKHTRRENRKEIVESAQKFLAAKARIPEDNQILKSLMESPDSYPIERLAPNEWAYLERQIMESQDKIKPGSKPYYLVSKAWYNSLKRLVGPETPHMNLEQSPQVGMEEERKQDKDTPNSTPGSKSRIEANQYEKLEIIEGANFDLVDYNDFESLVLDLGDNSELYSLPIRRGLVEGEHFFFVDQKTWDYIEEHWKGIGLPRYAIENDDGNTKIEIWFKKISFAHLADECNLKQIWTLYISDKDTVQDLIKRTYNFKRDFLVAFKYQEKGQVFKIHREKLDDLASLVGASKSVVAWPSEDLRNFRDSVADAEIGEDDIFVIEIKGDKEPYKISLKKSDMEEEKQGKPVSKNEIERIGYSLGINMDTKLRHGSRDGRCGLSNLGNTCFMNSALQCSFSMKELMDYFISNDFIQHINTTNKIGCGGKLAAAYANLVKSVFLGTEGAVSPWDFKKMIAKKAPVFSGYSQQDSMELLSYLLDGLHEDLNQVKDKPIVPSIDLESEENPEENAIQFWNSHLQRNKSKLVDLIYGQYKSKITCSKCERISVTYDPFSIVTLPVGESSSNNKDFNDKFFIYYISRNPEKKPEKIFFNGIGPKTTVKEITEALALNKKVSPKDLVFHLLVSFEIKQTVPVDSSETAKSIFEHQGLPFIYELSHPEDFYLSQSIVSSSTMMAENEEKIEERNMDDLKAIVTVKDTKDRIISFPKITLCKKQQTPSDLLTMVYQIIRPFICDRLNLKQGKSKKFDEEIQAFFGKEGGRPPFKLFLIKQEESESNPESEKQVTPGMKEENLASWANQSTLCGEHLNVKMIFLLDDVKLNKCEESFVSMKKREKEPVRGSSLLTCLDLFSEAEVLTGDNQWYCSRCKKHVNAKKEMNIWKASKYLILQLNRFKVNRVLSYGRIFMGGSTTKNSEFVSIPTDQVDLSDYILESGSGKSKIYDLIAVSNHFGGYGGGHYTATIRHYKGDWIYCNDSSVSSGGKNIGAEAYLLIYRRKD